MTYDVKPQATASSTSGLSTRDRTSPPLINDSNTEEHRDDSKRQGSHEKDRRRHHTVLTVDVKANKHRRKQTVKKLYDTDVAKVNNTLIRPEREKEAWVW
ncbi:hypothetical protein U0070_010038 [Myodes glareolus]|uniref:Uncharacterized protein n=1 Tax=Myodes glareolus TaxID=447135 RepID=A0AAW0I2R8_MYOGA